MPVSGRGAPSAWSPGSLRVLAGLMIVAIGATLLDALLAQALAQATPFGAPRPPAAASDAGGVVGWIIAKQAEFYRAMSAALRAAKTDGSAVTTLLGVSFLYGVFHAAGPGHGKAVISSYLLANEETAWRGVVLSFASAFVQALVAVLIVAIAAWLLNATSQTMCKSERVIEIASYALIAALGARLVWSKGRVFFDAARRARAGAADDAPHAHDDLHAHHDHAHHDHAHHDRAHHDHAHPGHADRDGGRETHADHAHHAHGEDGAHCGHAHGPDLAVIGGPGGWRNGLGAVLAVGLRPCSGAILVLVFALAQGLFWAGVAATFIMGLGTALTVAIIAVLALGAKDVLRRFARGRAGFGGIAVRFLEFGAAGLVLLFGVALLAGYAAAERVTCF